MYFSTLSPYIISGYGDNATVIFFASQLGFPLGYFASGYISDRLKSIRTLLILTILLQAPLQYVLYSGGNFQVTLTAAALTRFFFAFNFQLITISALENGGMEKFGNFRAYGTAGFFLIHALLFMSESGSLHFFKMNTIDADDAGKISSFFLIASSIPAFFIPRNRISEEHYYFKDVIAILKKTEVILFFVLSFFFYFSYQVVDYYLGAFLKAEGGMQMVYAAWAIAVILEIPFMPFTSRIFHFKKHSILFLISTLTGAIRFGILALHAEGLTAFPILITQLLHGIHFTGYYMGSIFRIKKIFPGHLYGTAYGFYMVLAASAGGMSGNFILGSFLQKENYFFSSSYNAFFENKFTYIFLISMSIHLLLFLFFFVLSEKDAASDKAHENSHR